MQLLHSVNSRKLRRRAARPCQQYNYDNHLNCFINFFSFKLSVTGVKGCVWRWISRGQQSSLFICICTCISRNPSQDCLGTSIMGRMDDLATGQPAAILRLLVLRIYEYALNLIATAKKVSNRSPIVTSMVLGFMILLQLYLKFVSIARKMSGSRCDIFGWELCGRNKWKFTGNLDSLSHRAVLYRRNWKTLTGLQKSPWNSAHSSQSIISLWVSSALREISHIRTPTWS